MDPFDTVYRKSYRPYDVVHKKFRQPPVTRKCNFDPFDKFLVDEMKKKPYQPGEQLYSDYAKNQFTEENPELAKIYLSDPINVGYLQHHNYHKVNTTYQMEYCGNLEELRKAKKRLVEESHVKLSENTQLPSTTYLFGYRDPSVLSSNALKRVAPIPQIASLGANKEMNEILHVVTGETEYESVIGKLGKSITEDEIHGKIVHNY